jgi:ADP-heptose:LPS heptosyltransferase
VAEQRSPKPFRERFYWQYAPVAAEVPALLRLQTLTRRSITSPGTVLIVNCCLIGDFVLSLPALTEFISEHAGARVDLLVSPSVAALAEKLRGVHRVYAARTVFRRDTELEESERLAPSYDFVIVLRLSGPARRLLAMTSYRAIRTCLIPLLKHGFQIATKPISQIKQMTEFNFEIFGKYGRKEQFLRADDVFDFSGIPGAAIYPRRTVLVHTGSGKKLYMWPREKWLALIERLHSLADISFVFVGGTEEEQIEFDYLASRVTFPLHSVIRRYDILELLMLMRVSQLFVGVDSGPRHLAHLVDLPSVSLLGPGPKSFQPLNSNATVIDKTECQRCVTFYCPHAPNCIEKIEVETVVRACLKALSTSGGNSAQGPMHSVWTVQQRQISEPNKRKGETGISSTDCRNSQ